MCSNHTIRNKFSAPHRNQAHVLGIGLFGVNSPPPLILSVPGPHHFSNHLCSTPHISCIPSAYVFNTRPIPSVCARYRHFGGQRRSPCSFSQSRPPPLPPPQLSHPRHPTGPHCP